MSLKLRAIVGIGLIEIVALSVLLYSMLDFIQDSGFAGVESRIDTSAELLATLSSDAVLSFDLAELQAIADSLAAKQGMLSVEIRGPNGISMAAAKNPSLSQAIDETLEIYTSVRPIIISGDAFGEVQISGDYRSVQPLIEQARVWGISIALAELLAVAAASVLFGTMLTRKIVELSKVTKRMSSGDFETPVNLEVNGDELDGLAVLLEQLRTELRTTRSQLQQKSDALNAKVDELELALQREKRLFSVVGHELRTPLAIAKMMLDQSPEQVDIRLLRAGVQHSLHLVDDMSVLVGTSEKQVPQLLEIQLPDFIDELAGVLEAYAKSEQLRFAKTISIERGVQVLAPVKAIRQIFSNLTRNAILHSQADQLSFEAHLVVTSSTSARLRLLIADNGTGIPDVERARLFKAYERGTTSGEGTGLGLSVCQELAERIGAQLDLKPYQVDEGSCFTLELELEIIEAPTTKSVCNSLDGLKVLLVEDDRTLQLLTSTLLMKQGAEVVTVGDGVQALNVFGPQFDLVLTDYMMPNMAGDELTRKLRLCYPELLIVAITAATVGREKEMMLEAGANRVLGKPLDINDLLRIVQSHRTRRDTGEA